jgi:hypothetical protein
MISEARKEQLREGCRRYRARHPERIRIMVRDNLRRRRAADPGYAAAARKKWKTANPEKVKEQVRRYSRKLRGQIEAPTHPCPAVCEACSQSPGKKPLAEDHDHQTGRFRGWLCHKCNLAFGLLGDDFSSIQEKLDYFRRQK